MSHVASRMTLFKLPVFRWYFLCCFFATIASGLFYINVTWLILTMEGTVSSVALVSFCLWAPVVLLSPVMGVIVDRYSRQQLLTWVSLYRGIALCLFLMMYFLSEEEWLVYLCVLLQGVGLSLALPVTFGIMRECVPEKLLLHANATVDIGYEVGNVLGMGLAGGVIYFVGFKGAFIVNALCYGGAAYCAAKMRLVPRIHEGIKSIKQVMVDYKDSLVYVYSKPRLMAIYSVQLLLMAQFMTIPVLIAPFAKEILHASVGQFGMMEACLSIGVVMGGLFIPWIADKWGHRRTVLLGLSMIIVLYSICMTLKTVWKVECLFLLLGFVYTIWPIVMTTAQSLTDLSYQGRVQSTFGVLASLAVLFVYWCLGVSGDYVATNYLFVIQIIFAAAALLLLLRVRL